MNRKYVLRRTIVYECVVMAKDREEAQAWMDELHNSEMVNENGCAPHKYKETIRAVKE